MSLLVTADIHLNLNPRDAHRWDLFLWLGEQAQAHDVDAVLVLGDLTDAKDRHSSVLVNRLVECVDNLLRVVNKLIFLKGNHDYIDEEWPFFQFLNMRDGVSFLTSPRTYHLNFGSRPRLCLFLPATRNWKDEWAEPLEDNIDKASFIFTHQTYDGCKAENGSVLQGVPPAVFRGFKGKVWSGDIHVPQKVGKNIEYVGAPYRVRFGDRFTPRVVLIRDDGTSKDLHFSCPARELIELSKLDDLNRWSRLKPGDQVKVRVSLSPALYAEWPEWQRKILSWAKGYRIELCGLEAVASGTAGEKRPESVPTRANVAETMVAYAKAKKLDRAVSEIGLAVLNEVVESGS